MFRRIQKTQQRQDKPKSLELLALTMEHIGAPEENLQNENTSAERIQILESEVESKKEEVDITISKLKLHLEEKEQFILQHKWEKKLKHRILNDHYMKIGQSTILKRLRKQIFKMFVSYKATFLALESEFQNQFQKHEKRFSEVATQKDKAFAETEERCSKILADCSEESTRQHIQELGHSEQSKRLRETTNAVWKEFDLVIQVWKLNIEREDAVLEEEMEELMGDYESSDSD
ncbi:hypothetical protein P8452_38967 [Trifolium repens]|nr:hypothetical protein P8452_38967 [Trifolium repens]